MLFMVAAMAAEMERDLIRERTLDAPPKHKGAEVAGRSPSTRICSPPRKLAAPAGRRPGGGLDALAYSRPYRIARMP